MSWILIAAFFIVGFVLLGKGADWLVGGSTVMARRFGVSSMVVGLTVVAWGTSLPEVLVSTMAAVQGDGAISLGNVLGSNIANIGLVLGACALVLPSVLEGRLGGRESFWMLAALALLWVFASDGSLGRVEGVLLLGMFAAHTADVFLQAQRQRKQGIEGVESETAEVLENVGKQASQWYKHPLVETFVGMVAIAAGAWAVVEGAKAGAIRLNVEPRIVALTVVALGTSLPELAAGLTGAFKGEKDISLGNVVGSNVFNVLAVMGITAVVHPLDAAMELASGKEGAAESAAQINSAFEGALASDFPLVLAFSLFLVALPFLGGKRYGRAKGVVLLGAYIGYSVWLYVG
jgi:cation:H+ antiporter